MVSDGSVVLISATAEAISSGNDSTAACHSGAANDCGGGDSGGGDGGGGDGGD